MEDEVKKVNLESVQTDNQMESEQEVKGETTVTRLVDDIEEQEADKGNTSRYHGIMKEVIFYVVLVLVCVFIIPKYIVQRTVVDGTSMDYTLKDHDNLIIEKVTYRFNDPERFDIIVLEPELVNEEEYFIKRIIGLPNETIQIKDGKIYINGKVIEDDYCLSKMYSGGIATEPIKLGDDEYFVMGDNRAGSKDSREIGPIHRDQIEGRAVLRIWPLNSFGTVD